MRLKIVLLMLAAVATNLSFAQTKKEVKVYLNESQFYSPEAGNYLEVQLNFAGYTLNYLETDAGVMAEVEITQVFYKGDSVVSADRYLLKSPLVIDSIVDDFFDIQRYPLKPGVYQHFLSIKDVNSKNKPTEASKKVEIIDLSGELSVSSLMAAESIIPNPAEQSAFTRFGYDVIPMLGTYYSTEIKNLLYYLEVYNADKAIDDSVYVVEQKLIGRDNNLSLDQYTRYFRYNTSDVQAVSKVIDISMLPTGAYTLEINVLNRENKILARSSFEFDRTNTDDVNEISYEDVIIDPAFIESIPKDSTGYYVASLIPIARQMEVKNIIKLLKEKNSEKNIQYLQAFWIDTDRKRPYEAWVKYKAQVQLVERLYATNYQVGFETDRGRVYLQYGAPNGIHEQPSSPSEYPYEIWQYDRIGNYSNRRFVFYSPNNLNKEYRLLHSDMIGELQNYRWQHALNKRNTPGNNLDDPTGGTPEHFGGNSSRYYQGY